MARYRWILYVVLLLLSVIVAAFFDNPLVGDNNTFYSWIFVGVWVCFSIAILEKVKAAKEFNSPHNTFFFIGGSYMAGYFFSAWGNFTTILGANLIQPPSSGLYISPWTMLLSWPYMICALYLQYACFRKYLLVYIGRASVNSKKIGTFTAVIILLFEITYNVILFNTLGITIFPVEAINPYIDFCRLVISISTIAIAIRFGRTQRIPSVAQRAATRATRSTGRVMTRSPQTSQRPAPRPRPAPVPRPTQPRAQPSQPRGMFHRVVVHTTKASEDMANLDLLRPKASVLSAEDFKCIFCFKLPKLPEDEKRGIVICPSCRHPAHADEFISWTKNSPLCSRCDTQIPKDFRKKPKIIPTSTYVEVIKRYSK